MANRLTMAEIDKILTLHTTAHTNREIADLLAINRETVGKYVARHKAQNRPNAPSGSEAADGLTMPTSARLFGASSLSGPPSECEPYREQILAKLEQGLSAKRISQDLVEELLNRAKEYDQKLADCEVELAKVEKTIADLHRQQDSVRELMLVP